MEGSSFASTPAEIRRALGWALVVGLTLAAVTASLALLTGSFDDTDEKVIFSSLAFSLYSGVFAAGASTRLRGTAAEEQLGTATVTVATLSFALFLMGLWGETDSETLWRGVGASAVTALAGAHACMMAGARRRSDSPLVSTMTTASVALGAFDAFLAVLGIIGAIDEPGTEEAEIYGVLLIALLLTTALAPILRRLQRPAAPARARDPVAVFATEVMEAADRIDELNRGSVIRAPEIRHEVERLRKLAGGYADR